MSAEKKIKRHNTKLSIERYTDLMDVKTQLVKLGLTDISLNATLSGIISYAKNKGITISDIHHFSDEGTDKN